MKKLVTIVSAVMMLLMLAACAPSNSVDADMIAAFEKASGAITVLTAFAQTDEDADVTYGENVNGTWTNTATADKKVLTATVKKDSTATFSYKNDATAKTITKTTSVNGTVVTKNSQNEDVSTKVEYASTTVDTYDKSIADATRTSISVDYLIIDDVAYNPYDYAAWLKANI